MVPRPKKAVRGFGLRCCACCQQVLQIPEVWNEAPLPLRPSVTLDVDTPVVCERAPTELRAPEESMPARVCGLGAIGLSGKSLN